MAWSIAISIEKYATTPAMGKVSYENGLDDVVCMSFIVSVPLYKICKATHWEKRILCGRPGNGDLTQPLWVQPPFDSSKKRL
jgi:hypothetical protein